MNRHPLVDALLNRRPPWINWLTIDAFRLSGVYKNTFAADWQSVRLTALWLSAANMSSSVPTWQRIWRRINERWLSLTTQESIRGSVYTVGSFRDGCSQVDSSSDVEILLVVRQNGQNVDSAALPSRHGRGRPRRFYQSPSIRCRVACLATRDDELSTAEAAEECGRQEVAGQSVDDETRSTAERWRWRPSSPWSSVFLTATVLRRRRCQKTSQIQWDLT